MKLQDHLPAVVLQQLLDCFDLKIGRLFFSTTGTELQCLLQRVTDPLYRPPDFHSYFAISDFDAAQSAQIMDVLRKHEAVTEVFADRLPALPPAVFTTEGIRYCPGYLDDAPRGINAWAAWQQPGGKGRGIRFADVEQGWDTKLRVSTCPASGISVKAFEQHGSDVLSVLLLPENHRGGSGIVPEAEGSVFSQWRSDGSFNTPDAVLAALGYLHHGDVLLLQAQCMDAGNRLWPVEIQPPVFEAIRLAAALGITVIEPAANGNARGSSGNNLDGFAWQGKKVLNRHHRDFRDSGAVMVGAATCTVPHRRMSFSNHGSRVDCYAWGEKVNAHHDFRIGLNGTSSAAAIIAGAVVALQGIAKARTGKVFTPARMRALLGNRHLGTGSARDDGIGVMPDLGKILSAGFHELHEGRVQTAKVSALK